MPLWQTATVKILTHVFIIHAFPTNAINNFLFPDTTHREIIF